MKYLVGILISVVIGVVTITTPFAILVEKMSEKIPILLAVLLAAVFVRLARGFPTMPYDKVSSGKALTATTAFRFLIKSYVQTLVIFVIAILLNLSLSAKNEIIVIFGQSGIYYILFFTTLFDCLVIVSLIFLVQSDVKLAHIQADLVDEVTNQVAATSASGSVGVVKEAFKTDRREGPSITQL